MKIETLSYGLSGIHRALPVFAVGKTDISGNSQRLRQIAEITRARKPIKPVLLRAP